MDILTVSLADFRAEAIELSADLKECANQIISLVHVSTAYVSKNLNKSGSIKAIALAALEPRVMANLTKWAEQIAFSVHVYAAYVSTNLSKWILITTLALSALALLYSVFFSSFFTVSLSTAVLGLLTYSHHLKGINVKLDARVFSDVAQQQQLDKSKGLVKSLELQVAESAGLVGNLKQQLADALGLVRECDQVLQCATALEASQQASFTSQKEALSVCIQDLQKQTPSVRSAAEQLIGLVHQFSKGQHEVFIQSMQQMKATTQELERATQEHERSRLELERSREQHQRILNAVQGTQGVSKGVLSVASQGEQV